MCFFNRCFHWTSQRHSQITTALRKHSLGQVHQKGWLNRLQHSALAQENIQLSGMLISCSLIIFDILFGISYLYCCYVVMSSYASCSVSVLDGSVYCRCALQIILYLLSPSKTCRKVKAQNICHIEYEILIYRYVLNIPIYSMQLGEYQGQ